MINAASFSPVYKETSEVVIITPTAYTLLHQPVLFGSVTVTSASGTPLLVSADYVVSYTTGEITWLTPLVGSEVSVSYRYNAINELLQKGIDYIADFLTSPLVTLDAQSSGGEIEMPDARRVVSVEALNCGCVAPKCSCDGNLCWDWQFNEPILQVAENGRYRICYLQYLTLATAPSHWAGCLNTFLLADAAASSNGSVLRVEKYGFGDESVELGYTESRTATGPEAALIRCLRSLMRGVQFGTRYRGDLPCL